MLQPDNVDAKFWKKEPDKKQRRSVLKRWLKERNIPDEYLIDELFEFTSNETYEASRKSSISKCFNQERGSKPYLEYSPGTKKKESDARYYRERKKKQLAVLDENSVDDESIIIPPPTASSITLSITTQEGFCENDTEE